MSVIQLPSIGTDLPDDYSVFRCNKSGCLVGNTVDHNYRARCPECNRLAKMYRIIE